MKKTLVYFAALLLVGCARSGYFPEIEDVLRQAVNNRKELEKVLEHYGRNPAETKLRHKVVTFLLCQINVS
jgi:hypothetical protein